MIKIELGDLIQNYLPYVRGIIERWMSSLSDWEKEIVEEIALEQLDGMEVRGKQGEKSKKALIRTVVTRRCIDHWRRIGSGAYSWFNPHDDPYRSKERKMWRAFKKAGIGSGNKRREKPLLMHLYRALEVFSLGGLKHVELFQDYALGLTRRQAAKKYGLNEQQVKGRIEYTKNKILTEIRKNKTQKELEDQIIYY